MPKGIDAASKVVGSVAGSAMAGILAEEEFDDIGIDVGIKTDEIKDKSHDVLFDNNYGSFRKGVIRVFKDCFVPE